MPRTVVAAASQDAAEAGQSIADVGGSAVDAAIAAALASMTTELGIVSPGAGAFLTVWPADGEPVVIDGYVEMPGRDSPDDRPVHANRVYMGYGGGMETYVGWGSVATPGAFAAFDIASQRFGSVPWQVLVEPAARLAREGFRVQPASAYYLQYSHDVVYGWDPETSAVFHRSDGSPVQEGDLVEIPALADTLTAIGREGADLLYHGELGAALVAASVELGGLITSRDLLEYRAILRDPLRTTLGHWQVATNAPPAVGGITVAALLTLVDQLDLSGWDADSVAAYAEAQDAVFSFRRSDLDGEHDRFAAAHIAMKAARGLDLGVLHRSPSTIHVSAVDSTGLACALTASAGYGSGATIPGTGFGLNNSLGEIELTTEGLHSLPVGSRLLSNMAPSIARENDNKVLAIGSPGADRITSAITTALYNHVICGMDLEEAVSAPRLHAEMFAGQHTIAVEPGIDTTKITGRTIRRLPKHSMYFGGVQIAAVDDTGSLSGAADPRRSGAVLVGGRD
jgi:gamma-glutamyltranspeptidase/glutathione hydrolase